MGMSGSGGVAFLNQAVQRGLDIPMIGQYFTTIPTGQLTNDQVEALPDFYWNASWTQNLDLEINQTFVEQYKSEYDRAPSATGEFAYSAGRLIGEVLHEADSVNSTDDFISAAEGHTLSTPKGETTIRECDHQGSPSTFISQLTGVNEEAERGEYEIVEEMNGEDFIAPCSDIGCSF